MLQDRHRWQLELLDPASGSSERFLVGESVDWEPAEEAARWAAVRRGGLSIEEAWESPALVEPILHPRLGQPYAAGFELRLDANGRGPLVSSYPIEYFKSAAEECAQPWIRDGRLTAGDVFRYRLAAFPRNGSRLPAPIARASVRTLAPAVAIEDSPEPTPANEMEARGALDPSDAPLFLSSDVLEITAEHALSAPDRETGGFLLGHLRRVRENNDIAIAVTGYIPARAEGTATRLSFTPECWTALRSAIQLRGRHEVLVGWVHSHIIDALCRNCPEEKRQRCALASGFFSEHDRAVHRVAFARAYQVALVVNLGFGKTTHSCFGWRSGEVAARGFQVLQSHGEPACPNRV